MTEPTSPKKRSSLRSLLPIWGLTLGILCGMLFVGTKRYIASQLVAILESEVQASCACTFQYDSISISLSSLQAFASNPRIEEEGAVKLSFRSLEADFSLERWRENQVLLTELRLFDGRAEGVGPSSATFRFIDQLAKPLPPDRDYPGRWKLKLQRLLMYSSQFTERLGSVALEGKGATLMLQRTPDNQFTLVPRIAQLAVASPSTLLATIRALEGDLFLHDDYIELTTLHFKVGSHTTRLTTRLDKEPSSALRGELHQTIAASDLEVQLPLEFTAQHTATLSGDLERQELRGRLHAPDLTIPSLPGSLGSVLDVLGSYTIESEPSGTTLTVDTFRLARDGIDLSLSSPIVLDEQGQLSGSATLNLSHLTIAGVSSDGISIRGRVQGTTSAPQLVLTGTAPSLQVAALTLGATSISGTLSPQSLDISGESAPPNGGTVRGRMAVDLSSPTPTLTEATIQFSDVRSGNFGMQTPLIARADLHLSGPLRAEKLVGDFELSVRSDLVSTFELRGEGRIRDGALTIALSNQSGSIDALTTLALRDDLPSEARVTVRDFSLTEYDPRLDCNRVSARLQASRRNGGSRSEGSLSIEAVELGCSPYTVRLAESTLLPIVDGTLQIPSLLLRGSGSEIQVSGALPGLSSFDLNVRGSLELSALAGVVPQLDDIRGRSLADAAIRGSFASPQVTGMIRLDDGGIDLEARGISLEQVHGDVELSPEGLRIEGLTGQLNGGRLSAEGRLPFRNWRESAVSFTFEDVVIHPADGVSAELSGSLALQPSPGTQPILTGSVEIDAATLERSFDLLSLLQAASREIAAQSNRLRTDSTGGQMGLDIRVASAGGMFIATNILSTELSADLRIEGNTAVPRLRGSLIALGGWVRVHDRRFDITDGVVEFRADRAEPHVSLLAESSVFSRQGESVLVLLEVGGALTQPRVTFNSDRGLTQAQILDLLARSGNLSDQALLASQTSSGRLAYPFESDGATNLQRFLVNLATPDILTIQPTVSRQRGTLEPVLVAEKRLSPNLTVIGETSLAAGASESRAQLSYRLTDRLTVSGEIESLQTRRSNALGADLRYQILGSSPVPDRVYVTGSTTLTSAQAQRILRITAQSRFDPSQLTRVKRQIARDREQLGFHDAVIEPLCTDEACTQIRISVDDGQQSTLAGISVHGATRTEKLILAAIRAEAPPKVASSRTAERLRVVISSALRNEGFIGARVETSFERLNQGERRLRINVTEGRPVTFLFRGNRIFSEKDFLNTINLFTRRQPFGINTINILTENIERLYREAGYLAVTVSSRASIESKDDRLTYTIEIEEGDIYPVSSVSIEILGERTEEDLKVLLEESNLFAWDTLARSTYAIAEELDGKTSALSAALKHVGYPDATVTYSLQVNDSKSTVAIAYTIALGEQTLLPQPTIIGWPPNVSQPALAGGAVSDSHLERYRESLRSALAREGFLQSTVTSSPVSPSAIVVEPGTRTIVDALVLEGIVEADAAAVRSRLSPLPPFPWSEQNLTKVRQRLLELGLFEKIEFQPADGALDEATETLEVRLTERPLRTLSMGTGLNSEYGVRLFTEFQDRKLFGDGRTIISRVDLFFDSADFAPSQGVAGIQYNHPRILGSRYRLTEDLRFQRNEQSSYEFNVERAALSTTLYRLYQSGLTHTFGHSLQHERLFDVSEDAVLGPNDSGSFWISALAGTFTFDRRDDPLLPHRGYALALDYKLADKYLGSDTSFLALGLRGSTLYTPSQLPRWTITWAGRAGIQEPLHDTDIIPISERYYAGGQTSVRGFRENSLGPRGDQGSVLGGDLLIAQSLELRYKVTDELALQTFLDSGSVFLRDRGTRFADLRESVGIGMRYLSPIGPIGLDVGFPLNPQGGESDYRVHFAVGATF